MERFWKQFEEFIGCKIPKIIKEILSFCAIDTLVFDEINEQVIKDIEQTVNRNKSILKNSAYDKDGDFQFLLGHRILLLSFPKKYQLFCEDLKNKKTSRKQRLANLKSPEVEVSDLQETDSENADPEFSPERIRNSLVTKINAYTEKNKLKYKIVQNQIKKFKIKGNEAYCVVNCTFCDVKVPCVFNSSWNHSNFNNHIRSHLNNNQISDSPIQQSTSNISFQPARSSVLEELDQILR